MYIRPFESLRVTKVTAIFAVLLNNALVIAQEDIELTMFDAVSFAQEQDPLLQANHIREDSLRALSVAAGAFPDPVVSVDLANMPTNSLDFSQEAMTQFRVDLTQVIPRGDTRNLRRAQFNRNGDQYPFQRDARRAWVAMTVSKLWLDVYAAQHVIELIESERGLFDQLAEVVEANYANTHGGTRQQDLIRAQIELTSLEDRLILLRLDRRTAQAQLSEWIGETAYTTPSSSLPELVVSVENLLTGNLISTLVAHPKIRALDEHIRALEIGVSLAEQQYKPSWSINASYGYRDDDPLGNTRADLFSIGVGFDLPLFPTNRQDKIVESATAEREASKIERILSLRELRSGLETALQRDGLLRQRMAIYNSRLLVQESELRGSALNSYISNDGDFSEVVHAHHAELNSKIEQIYIAVEIRKTLTEINYYLSGSAGDSSAQSTRFGDAQ